MGVTIKSKNKSIDMGCGGFHNLRTKVAELTSKDIYEHYCSLKYAPLFGEERTQFFEEYDKKIVELAEKHKGKYNKILDFLYESDISGKMTYGTCKKIWEIIKDYDDNILYGYVGRPDCAKFKDFKEIIKDCVDAKTKLIWY